MFLSKFLLACLFVFHIAYIKAIDEYDDPSPYDSDPYGEDGPDQAPSNIKELINTSQIKTFLEVFFYAIYTIYLNHNHIYSLYCIHICIFRKAQLYRRS